MSARSVWRALLSPLLRSFTFQGNIEVILKMRYPIFYVDTAQEIVITIRNNTNKPVKRGTVCPYSFLTQIDHILT